jgi:hypothetical protein
MMSIEDNARVTVDENGRIKNAGVLNLLDQSCETFDVEILVGSEERGSYQLEYAEHGAAGAISARGWKG